METSPPDFRSVRSRRDFDAGFPEPSLEGGLWEFQGFCANWALSSAISARSPSTTAMGVRLVSVSSATRDRSCAFSAASSSYDGDAAIPPASPSTRENQRRPAEEAAEHLHPVFTGEAGPLANLMLCVRGAFAEFKRNLIGGRQREGITLAKKRGAYRRQESPVHRAGRRTRPTCRCRRTEAALAHEYGISHETVYQYLRHSAE